MWAENEEAKQDQVAQWSLLKNHNCNLSLGSEDKASLTQYETTTQIVRFKKDPSGLQSTLKRSQVVCDNQAM